ncbi:uncharacterized protein LOC131937288 [Physella acuta]|uniref:uncharacterized protein LOC131937288 n=1 Tax=Physella acuta TaxID=109671 RepID=UPI0027DC1145|nr:uncharacterized protein LOC131937288 [Physella acuta]
MKLQILLVLYLTTFMCMTREGETNDKTSINLQRRSPERYPLPYVGEIRFPMYSGKEITVEGPNSREDFGFTVKLCQTVSCGSEVALELNINPNENKMIRSSSYDNESKKEDDYGVLIFKSENQFKIDIIITDSIFKIYVDGDIFVTYPNNMPIANIKYIHISGKVVVQWILFSYVNPVNPVKIERRPGGERIIVYGHRIAEEDLTLNIRCPSEGNGNDSSENIATQRLSVHSGPGDPGSILVLEIKGPQLSRVHTGP